MQMINKIVNMKKQFQNWEEWFLETNTPICEETLNREFPCIPNVLARRGIKGATEIVFKDSEKEYDPDDYKINQNKVEWKCDKLIYLSRMGQLVYCLLFKYGCELLSLRDINIYK